MAVSPAYTIHRYRDDIYKVVAFKGNRDPDVMYVRDREEQQHNDAKLDSNFSRARSMVLQYALCNPWDYFFTGTLDREKMDRYDLDTSLPGSCSLSVTNGKSTLQNFKSCWCRRGIRMEPGISMV